MKAITFKDLEQACEGLKTTPIERFNKKTGQKETKEYIEVAQRIVAFRRVYPMGYIITNIVQSEPGVVTMQAEVGYYDDNGEKVAIATGMAQEAQNANIINKTSYIENCETSAIGRALGMAGFGLDAGITSADEMQQALRQQEALEKPQAPQAPKQTPQAPKLAPKPAPQAPKQQAPKIAPDAPITIEAAKKLANLVVCIDAVDKTFWPEMQEAFGFAKSTQIKQRDYTTICTQATKRLQKLRNEGLLDADYKPIPQPEEPKEDPEKAAEEKKTKAKAKAAKTKAEQKAKAEAETGEQVGFEDAEAGSW